MLQSLFCLGATMLHRSLTQMLTSLLEDTDVVCFLRVDSRFEAGAWTAGTRRIRALQVLSGTPGSRIKGRLSYCDLSSTREKHCSQGDKTETLLVERVSNSS